MRGFTDTDNPVMLHVSPAFEEAVGANGPFPIDGGAAERETDGLLVVVAGTRFFVPAAHVVMVTQELEQQQPPAPPQQQPPANPGTPAPGETFANAVAAYDQQRRTERA